MFTGIIEGLGRISKITRIPGGVRLRIGWPKESGRLSLGDSVAVDGTCLTVVSRGRDWFDAEVSPETLRRTTLGAARAGSRVNLERPLAASGRMGGHFVQGHVDGVGKVKAVAEAHGFSEMSFTYPAAWRGMLVEKGSVAVNGVSLTVAGVTAREFKVALIPHTLSVTNLGGLKSGAAVNLEIDILAKYVKALLEGRGTEGKGR